MMLPLGLPRRSQDGHVQGDRERCARLIRVRVPWWRWSPAWPGRAELFGQPEWPGPPSIVLVDISDKQGVRAITSELIQILGALAAVLEVPPQRIPMRSLDYLLLTSI